MVVFIVVAVVVVVVVVAVVAEVSVVVVVVAVVVVVVAVEAVVVSRNRIEGSSKTSSRPFVSSLVLTPLPDALLVQC